MKILSIYHTRLNKIIKMMTVAMDKGESIIYLKKKKHHYMVLY